MNKSITKHHLHVDNFNGLIDFYRDLLGMHVVQETNDHLIFEFHRGCQLCFSQPTENPADGNLESNYTAQDDAFYWKIGITVRDLDAVVMSIKQNDVDKTLNITAPVQFLDIGYLSKLTDPKGFTIELLQQGFEGNAKPLVAGHQIGAQATLAHITLRVTDIDASKHFFEDELGMRLISVQPVKRYGFCLYFYCWDQAPLPNPDVKAVENREWLWERPYTLIELKHIETESATIQKNTNTKYGFEGFSYQKNAEEIEFVSLRQLSNLT